MPERPPTSVPSNCVPVGMMYWPRNCSCGVPLARSALASPAAAPAIASATRSSRASFVRPRFIETSNPGAGDPDDRSPQQKPGPERIVRIELEARAAGAVRAALDLRDDGRQAGDLHVADDAAAELAADDA